MSIQNKLFIVAVLVAFTALGFSQHTVMKLKKDLAQSEERRYLLSKKLQKLEEDKKASLEEIERMKILLSDKEKEIKKQLQNNIDLNNENRKLAEQNNILKKEIEKEIEKRKEIVVSRSSQYKNSSIPQSSRSLTVEASGYTANCAEGCTGITATGINLNANRNAKVIAVDPRVIPLGTKVYVEGYGYAVAGDTGGAIKGNKIDLHFATHNQAINWGRRTVTVKILN